MQAISYIEQLTAHGNFSFTTKEIRDNMKISNRAVEGVLYRLKKKKSIANVVKGYYLVLTPQFKAKGCLPPNYFIDDLMKYWNQNYYVCLLSAAMYHGAAHQQPQVFQVMVDRHRRPISCGRVRIEFVINKNLANANLANTLITKLKMRTGYMNVSTPEATMIDLCVFLQRSGGIGRVSTILSELAEIVTNEILNNLLIKSPLNCIRRLGYLLDTLDYKALAEIIYNYVKLHKTSTILLAPYNPVYEKQTNKKWKIIVNSATESDLNGSN